MKAAVLETSGKKAVVLLEDGTFKTIKNDNYSVGEELEITTSLQEESRTDRIMNFTRRNMPVVAAAAAFVVMLSGGLAVANVHESSVVTLDINPSLKYSLNVFDKVIDMDSYNDDGAEIVSQISSEVKGKSLETAVKDTLDELDRTGYVGEDTAVVVTLNSKTKSEDQLETQVIGSVGKWNNEKNDDGESKSVNVETVKVTPQMADSAEDKNVSPGKIYIVGKLKEQVLEEASFDEDEWLEKSVKEIEEATDVASETASAKTEAAVSVNKKQVQESANIAVVAANANESSVEAGEPAVTNDEKPAEAPKKSVSKKASKKVSSNGTTSANGAEAALAGGEGGGTSLSTNATVAAKGGVSVDQIINPTATVTDPNIELPSISSEPVPNVASPVETEPVTVDVPEIQKVDQLGVDSSYLDISLMESVMCDDIPAEDQM